MARVPKLMHKLKARGRGVRGWERGKGGGWGGEGVGGEGGEGGGWGGGGV